MAQRFAARKYRKVKPDEEEREREQERLRAEAKALRAEQDRKRKARKALVDMLMARQVGWTWKIALLGGLA